jgi:hypothetical protein
MRDFWGGMMKVGDHDEPVSDKEPWYEVIFEDRERPVGVPGKVEQEGSEEDAKVREDD